MTGAGDPKDWTYAATAPGVHDRVFDLLRGLAGNGGGRTALDLPCGTGNFSARLADAGFRVVSMDIVRDRNFLFDERRLVIADLNGGIPLADGSVDVITAIEGIEHLENPSFFLRECRRVVKAGGHVLVTTPNVDSFRSRRKRFLDGYYTFFNPVDAETRASGHLHPIDMVFFRGASARAGFRIVDVAVNRIADEAFSRFAKNLVRPLLTRRLPETMRGEIPFFGDVIIYVLRPSS
jgi:SAM-dependent methyltransferase